MVVTMMSTQTRHLLTATLLWLGGCGWNWFGYELDARCNDALCGWEVEQGQAMRTGTWHPNDYGVSLSAVPSVIGRDVPVTSNTGCLRVKYLSAVEPSAGATLRVDFNDDGSDDLSIPLPTSDWKPQSLTVNTPSDYRRLRMRIAKTGDGLTEIAQFVVGPESSCGSPRPTLANGAECSLDATCSSQRCVSGRCGSCGVGGCVEGEACRADSECLDGGCAGGVCRACAKQGSCGAGERCSSAAQCGARSCVAGSQPNLTSHPDNDATCGDCSADADCSGGKCALGRCGECVSDADCTGGRSCRYFDLFDATVRGCVPKLASQLPRGALCESDTDCRDQLRCAGAPGRAKRCGVACGTATDCAASESCIAPGAAITSDVSDAVSLMSAWNDPVSRISTCYPRLVFGGACQLHQQCWPGVGTYASCCDGTCGVEARDSFTGACLDVPYQFWSFP
jgi:hypothetical protein